jgi:DNA-binding transcriptional LysR family regulator
LDNPRADLNAVNVFVCVVQAKTFRAAARELGLPKSTVSFRVAQLEDRLGERLLERTTRRLRLTEAGAAYYARVAPALDAMREAEQVLESRKIGPTGLLRVSATFEGGQFTLAPLFAEYMRRHPEVGLQIVLSDRHVDLIEENIDVAIRAGSLPDSSLVARKLSLGGGMRVLASPKYLERRGTPRRPRELENHDCLVMSSQSRPSTWTFHERRKVVTVDVRPRAEANSFVVLAELAKADLGIVRMPEHIARDAIESGALRPVLDAYLPPPPSGGYLHAVYPSARHLSAKVRAFLDLLDEQGRAAKTQQRHR